MADINYTASTLKKTYTRRIGDHGFLGADFSTAPIFASERRFRDLKNVWKDYKSGSGVAIETVPGYRKLIESSGATSTIRDIAVLNLTNPSSAVELWNENNKSENPSFVPVDTTGRWIVIDDGQGIKVCREKDLLEGNTAAYEIPCSVIGGVFEQNCYNDNRMKHQRATLASVGNFVYCFCTGSFGNEVIKIMPLPHGIAASNNIGMSYGDAQPPAFVAVCQYKLRTGIGSRPEGEDPYIPTTYRNGIQYEQKNMLTSKSREVFTAETETIDGVENCIRCVFHERLAEETSGFDPIKSIIMDGYNETGVTREYDGFQRPVAIVLDGVDPGNHTVEVVYWSDPVKFSRYEDYIPFTDGNPGYTGTAYDAIAGCTICASFDERIFLTGNPKLPNTVFYSQRDLTGYNNTEYFGVLNYNNLGTSNVPITAMIPSANALYVLKDDSATDPTVYVLSGLSTEKDLIPRIYTVESGLPGIGCKGAACNFLDDIVFMSRNGVIGIDKQAVNLERTLGDRSVLINGKLLLEDVTQAVFAEAEGYLWCLFKNNGHVYLADSRAYTQVAGYEWYFIDSVGSWSGDADYYDYTDEDIARNGATIVTDEQLEYLVKPSHKNGEQVLDGNGNPIDSTATYTISIDGIEHDVILVEDEDGDGNTVYHQVVKTGEKVGGTFHPATCMVASTDRIFFGTDNGDLLTFNNDKRGVQAESEIAVRAEDNPIDGADIYEQNRYPFMLRPEWYSFCGHRIESFVETSDDDGGIGNLTKNTVRRSAVVDMKAMLGSRYSVSIYTDRDGWKEDVYATGAMNDAIDADQSATNFSGDDHVITQIRERTRKWVHKRYRIESNGFCSSFGLYRITYDFEINGRVK